MFGKLKKKKKIGVQSEARVLQLQYELNALKKESLGVKYYCIKMKSIGNKLTSAGSPITKKRSYVDNT